MRGHALRRTYHCCVIDRSRKAAVIAANTALLNQRIFNTCMEDNRSCRYVFNRSPEGAAFAD